MLDEFYTNLNRETTERLLAPDFEVYEAGDGVDGHRFSREDYLHLMHDTLLQAIPDFQCVWGPAGRCKSRCTCGAAHRQWQ